MDEPVAKKRKTPVKVRYLYCCGADGEQKKAKGKKADANPLMAIANRGSRDQLILAIKTLASRMPHVAAQLLNERGTDIKCAHRCSPHC